MEAEKKCFKCGKRLPLSSFYRHPSTADGHLNKCKECTKKDVHRNYTNKIADESFVDAERERSREKYRRLYAELHIPSKHNENKKTNLFLRKQGLNMDGKEAHHWNYNDRNDVFILSKSLHRNIHLFLKFDEETKCFRYKGELITTKDRHREVLKEIISLNKLETFFEEYPYDTAI